MGLSSHDRARATTKNTRENGSVEINPKYFRFSLMEKR